MNLSYLGMISYLGVSNPVVSLSLYPSMIIFFLIKDNCSSLIYLTLSFILSSDRFILSLLKVEAFIELSKKTDVFIVESCFGMISDNFEWSIEGGHRRNLEVKELFLA
jgi:hypothetical protein